VPLQHRISRKLAREGLVAPQGAQADHREDRQAKHQDEAENGDATENRATVRPWQSGLILELQKQGLKYEHECKPPAAPARGGR
jgi:hypothetical protein